MIFKEIILNLVRLKQEVISAKSKWLRISEIKFKSLSKGFAIFCDNLEIYYPRLL